MIEGTRLCLGDKVCGIVQFYVHDVSGLFRGRLVKYWAVRPKRVNHWQYILVFGDGLTEIFDIKGVDSLEQCQVFEREFKETMMPEDC